MQVAKCNRKSDEIDCSLPQNAEKSSIQPAKDKKIYFELIRAFSMLLVIFNHTGIRGFFLFSKEDDSVFYLFYLFISVSCKIAVPLFWMISGALLLPKEESIKRVYVHRVLRMVLVLVLFSILCFLYTIVKDRQQINPSLILSFLTTLYRKNWAAAYWFIYAYIGILMMLPFLRKLVKNMTKDYFHYLFLLVFFFRGILPILEYLVSTLPARIGLPFNPELKICSLNSNVTDNFFSEAVLFFLFGYYFDHLLTNKEITKKGAAKWLGIGLIAIVTTCFMTCYHITVTGVCRETATQTFYNNLICLPTFATFYSMRLLFQEYHFSDNIKKIILSFGQCAFGIMLCEEILRRVMNFVYEALVPIIHGFPACIVWVLAVYLSGYVITLCLKRIPGLRSLI